MKNECGQIHSPNYLTTCCIRHLLEMSKYAEMQTQTKKYSKLLLTTLNHAYKENTIAFKSMKLDLIKLLLEVLSKYISHFFNLSIIIVIFYFSHIVFYIIFCHFAFI